MTHRVFNALFLCSGNSARSILAESILAKDGAGRFHAFSAGSLPKGEVNPLAIETLRSFGYPTEGLRSKSWDEFEKTDAPHMDFIFTVCDSAAGEACPIWLGHPQTAHWGIEDPSSVEGTPLERKQAFAATFRYLKNRISTFIALPFERLDRTALTAQLEKIGRQPGATVISVEDK